MRLDVRGTIHGWEGSIVSGKRSDEGALGQASIWRLGR